MRSLQPLEALPVGIAVNVGNPHIVFEVPDAGAIDVPAIGPRVENHPLFPDRTNVEFVSWQQTQAGGVPQLRLRVWERGAGETLACGSAACAAFAAMRQLGRCGEALDIVMDGGTLRLEADASGQIFMTGPVAHVCSGVLSPELLQPAYKSMQAA